MIKPFAVDWEKGREGKAVRIVKELIARLLFSIVSRRMNRMLRKATKQISR